MGIAHSRTLEDLTPGQSRVILNLSNQSRPVKRRLSDMGLTPGTFVTVKKIAPFGDPIEIRLRGYELSLRKADAAQIEVGDTHPVKIQKRSSGGYIPRRHDAAALRRMRLGHEHELDKHSITYAPSAHEMRKMHIALVGNPNSGKTTLFNALTGSSQYVGNWPGVTVEKKEGTAVSDGCDITIVDLPGIYSLSPYSMEEIVARDYIIDGHPDAIINIVDATNIERNLYLTVQLLELEMPMVLALNFMDESRKAGDEIDVKQLSKELGIPVIPISAKTGENLDELLHVAHRQMQIGCTMEPDNLYDDYTHEIRHRVGELIHDRALVAGVPANWASIKLIEGDELVEKALDLRKGEKEKLDTILREYESRGPLRDRETRIADSRYAYIEQAVSLSMKKGLAKNAETVSDKIDKVLTHRVFAVPLFLAMMLTMFILTFGTVGAWLSGGVSVFITQFSHNMSVWLTGNGTAAWLVGLVSGGIITGVGGILTFLPQIALLFFFLSLLEDSGYMSRAAFIMDRLLRRFGLSGKAFIPMIMGFGCSVPAVMGARTMENEKDRRMTIMLIPFMSCSAKLPVYGLITSAFFGAWAGLVVFGLYVLGMLLAIVSGLIFQNTLFRGEPAAFVLELPPYRLPSLGNTFMHVWERVRHFLVKAGTLILLMSIVLWFLQNFDTSLRLVTDSSKSLLGHFGGMIAPLFRPLGFGVWQAAVALLAGLVAKEAVVSSLGMFYGFELSASGAVIAASMTGFSPLSALSFLVFILLYIPCIAAVSAIHKEMNSLRWTLRSVTWQLLIAYCAALIVYQFGRLLGLG